MSADFVHLRLHTEYSLIDSVVRVPELIEAVAGAGMPAVAVTDQSNLFAMVKFYRAALERGVKPLVGVDLLVREAGERQQPTRLTLICQSQAGYRNVTRLVSRAYLEGQQRGVPMIERGWLSAQSLEGLIGLSCAAEGDLGRALVNGREHDAERSLEDWLALLPERFYIELQRLGRPEEEPYIASAVALASRHGVPVVATNDVRFLEPGHFESHEARVCIHDGTLLADTGRTRRYTAQQYLRTPQEMRRLFADIPEALANSVEIARRSSLTLKLGEARLPAYPVPGGMSTEDFLRREAGAGLERRLAQIGRAAEPAAGDYRARLAAELEVICQMGFAGYFLIVADFIRWARANGVPVGPGRGSGAGSLVAYSLSITDLDPIHYDLLFERFLNPERVSMPDFDVDFCMEGRDRVIEYVAGRYGRERVSQIITYGTMAAKAVVRDVGRVLGMTYGYVDRIAKLIPFELGITLAEALEKEPELKKLYDAEEDVHNLIDLARSLEGLTRNAGMHAGGVVIAPSVLTDFAPLYCDESGASLVTQFDKDDVEAAGLVKFDFLGLRTLTIIDRTVKAINALRAGAGESLLEIARIPLDDAATYELFKKAQTAAVFQFESSGMQRLLKDAKPDRFEDLIALGALFRPGPMELIPEYVACKGGKKPEYLHPDMEEVLRITYGVFVYQEQVMQIAQRLAGYSLGGADLLRRAMGKKKPEEMAKQRGVFVAGATARGLAESAANAVFDQMEKFAGYGFNKSHAAAYALVSYQTAYLKAHFPGAFMAAVLSADMDHTDKVVGLVRECESIGLAVQPPDINSSVYEFAVSGASSIRYGLGAIRGVGRGAVEVIIAERETGGPYTSLQDLCRRLDLQKVNRRVLEALLRSGSLDALGPNRATLMHSLPAAMQLGGQNSKAEEAGQNDMFGLEAGASATAPVASTPAPAPPCASLAEWPESTRLAGERETLGLYLTGHPIGRFESGLERVVTHRIGDLVSGEPWTASVRPAGPEGARFGGGKPVAVAGLIDEVRKRGPRVILTLDDRTGRIETSLFEEVYQKHRDLIVKDALILVEGQLRFDEFSDSWRLSARRISDLARICEQRARRVVVRWPLEGPTPLLQARFAEVLGAFRPGPCPVTVEYAGAGAHGALTLGPEWTVRASGELIDALEALLGRGAVEVVYAAPAASPGPTVSADGR